MVPLNVEDLNEIFDNNHRNADKARVILQYLFFMKMRMKKDKNFASGIKRTSRYVPVNSRSLKKMVRNYSEIIRTLLEHNIIEYKLNDRGGKSYMPTKCTMLYRIKNPVTDPKTNRKYRVEYITHPDVIKSVELYYYGKYDRQVQQLIGKYDWLSSTVEFIDQLYLDVTPEQIAGLESDKELNQDYLLGFANQFNNRLRRFINRDNYSSRLHSHLSNMPSVLRPFLKLKKDDSPLVLIDVKSAQPFLLSCAFYHPNILKIVDEFNPILPIIRKYQHTLGVRLFYEDCIAGTFYSGLMEASGMTKASLKQKLFEHIFYSSYYPYKDDEEKGTERWKIHQLFCGRYRDVLRLLNQLKQTRKSTLPFVAGLTKMYCVPNILAARLESTIFIDGITRQCAEEDIPVATIHDAWVLKEADQSRFMEVFLNEFKLLTVNSPQVEVTNLMSNINIGR